VTRESEEGVSIRPRVAFGSERRFHQAVPWLRVWREKASVIESTPWLMPSETMKMMPRGFFELAFSSDCPLACEMVESMAAALPARLPFKR